MDTTIVVNWAFSLNESIRDYVKNNYREDSHRWPANYGFDAKGFSMNDKYLIVILYDKNLQIPWLRI
jgi:hypothetical protein